MGFLSIAAVLASFVYLLRLVKNRISHVFRSISCLQGPAAIPILGNFHQLHLKPDEFFEQAEGLGYMLRDREERFCRIWISGIPFVVLYGAEECETVLNNSRMLNKPLHYNFLSSWIGEGLLISKPDKWRPRRKLLTPTFHYDILKDFVEVYNRHARTLVEKIWIKAGDKYADVFHTVTLCTLDVICEAALGVCIHAQSKPSPYLDAVMKIKKLLFDRMLNPLLYPSLTFKIFGRGKEHDECVKILHDFTGKAIRARKKVADDAGGVEALLKNESAEGKRKMAFLDLMLDMHAKGELPMSGIQEEVDTFVFEGHDTTATSMNWFLHLMGANPEKQAKVHRELDEVLGDSDSDVSYEDLSKLKYLEAAFKETIRLYPSVPLIARQCMEDLKLKNHILPAGTAVIILPALVHKDEKYWEDPEAFIPERFLDDSIARHPYSYIPFSAGSRNCIGSVTHVLVKAKLPTHEMRITSELIIRPMYGNAIMLQKRTFGDYSQGM